MDTYTWIPIHAYLYMHRYTWIGIDGKVYHTSRAGHVNDAYECSGNGMAQAARMRYA